MSKIKWHNRWWRLVLLWSMATQPYTHTHTQHTHCMLHKVYSLTTCVYTESNEKMHSFWGQRGGYAVHTENKTKCYAGKVDSTKTLEAVLSRWSELLMRIMFLHGGLSTSEASNIHQSGSSPPHKSDKTPSSNL